MRGHGFYGCIPLAPPVPLKGALHQGRCAAVGHLVVGNLEEEPNGAPLGFRIGVILALEARHVLRRQEQGERPPARDLRQVIEVREEIGGEVEAPRLWTKAEEGVIVLHLSG